MVICIKQHLNNIWSWIHEFMKKFSNTEAALKKGVIYKKVCNSQKPLVFFRSIVDFRVGSK